MEDDGMRKTICMNNTNWEIIFGSLPSTATKKRNESPRKSMIKKKGTKDNKKKEPQKSNNNNKIYLCSKLHGITCQHIARLSYCIIHQFNIPVQNITSYVLD